MRCILTYIIKNHRVVTEAHIHSPIQLTSQLNKCLSLWTCQLRMTAIAPNLTYMVGELVGARLISQAGSACLENVCCRRSLYRSQSNFLTQQKPFVLIQVDLKKIPLLSWATLPPKFALLPPFAILFFLFLLFDVAFFLCFFSHKKPNYCASTHPNQQNSE